MEALMNFFGLSPVVGYEYVHEILKGCIAVFVTMEILGWLKSFQKMSFHL